MVCIVCGKKLRSHNKIGTCRKHRSLSKIRRAYEKAWQFENKDQYAEAKNRWTRENPEYFKNYRNSDPSKRIAHALRVRLRKAVKKGSAVKNLGCTVFEFLTYLKNKFVEGMTWKNYGEWHLDHIHPLSMYDLTDSEQLKQACHYSNIQPLWASDNISKNNKLDYLPKSAQHVNT